MCLNNFIIFITLPIIFIQSINCDEGSGNSSSITKKLFYFWNICFILAPKLGYFVKTLNKNQTIGSIFGVFCTLEEGSLPVFFEWFKDSKPLKSNPNVNYKIEITTTSSIFSISSVASTDQGNYTCAVKNPFGSDSQTVILNIKGMFNSNHLFCSQLFEYRLMIQTN